MSPEYGVYCFIFCFGSVEPSSPTPPVETFCTVYQRQIITKEDYALIRNLPRKIKDRMQVNDLYYLCRCKGWKGKECLGLTRQ